MLDSECGEEAINFTVIINVFFFFFFYSVGKKNSKLYTPYIDRCGHFTRWYLIRTIFLKKKRLTTNDDTDGIIFSRFPYYTLATMGN